ncbi:MULTISPECIES: hypothetical protein [unclassified Streptomyces]|uniref:hypothetical protein n=1 Tax=unclassified Streptomyces TaxID=2593676 RepID=UPI00114CEFB2|nr:hypothetical protein [Streptomyces sp. MnatMP-M77]MYT82346.1 hypothetical protein [Streptomyces sp. SID8364]
MGRLLQARGWLAALLGGVLALMITGGIMALPGQLFNVPSLKDDIRSGPDVSVAVVKVQLEDEGMSRVTRRDHRPSASLRQFLSRQGAAASPDFDQRLQSVGAVNLERLTLRVVFTGHRNQTVNIVNIEPEIVERGAPWSGTLFSVPSQAGSPTMKMMFDLDRPRPVARKAKFDEEKGRISPGGPFFGEQTITLKDTAQQVVMVRAVTARHYVAFRLKATYMLGNKTRSVTIDDRGKPFQVTAVSGGSDRLEDVKYHRVFALDNDFSLCQTVPATPSACENQGS